MMLFIRISIKFVVVLLMISCSNKPTKERSNNPSVETIKRNIDSTVSVYGRYAAVKLPIKSGVTLWNPTAVTIGPGGVMYAANYTGEIFSLHDTDGDGLEDHAKLFCNVTDDALRYPTSIIFKGNKLFVGTTQEIRVYEDLDSDEVADTSYTFFDDFPWTLHYFDWTFGLDFDNEGYLYIILCTDQLNGEAAPDPTKLRGSILKIAPDGKSYERFASGLRFAYGMKFNDQGDLFYTDNRGNENKYEELNFAVQGKFYGNNPSKFPDQKEVTEPLLKLMYGFSPVGIDFNPKENDFDGTGGDLFVSFFGPDGQWENGSISRVRLTKEEDGSYDAEEFPVADKIAKLSDVEFGAQGDMYVSQFGNDAWGHEPFEKPIGAIYRFIEADWIVPSNPETYTSIVSGNKQMGKAIFKQRACASCHSVDGSEGLLGPDLLGIGQLLSKEQILESITDPNKNIKSGFDQVQIKKKDGSIISGRMSTSNSEEITLIIAGNEKIKIRKEDIESSEMIQTSLMPPGLLNGLNETDINDLLGYMQSLK